jgi:geranyl-CoA carboxylase alpha subunit
LNEQGLASPCVLVIGNVLRGLAGLGQAQEAVLARRSGWAIEVRLCTEDPADNFLPQTGPVLAWHAPHGGAMRSDHGLRQGATVSPYYDSMQAKLIASGDTREQACRTLLRMLDHTVLLGVSSNRDYLRQIIAHPVFAAGDFSTGFITEHLSPESFAASRAPTALHSALAAVLLYRSQALALQADAGLDTELLEWQSSAPAHVPLLLQCGERKLRPAVTALGQGAYHVQLDGQTLALDVLSMQAPTLRFMHQGLDAQAHYALAGKDVHLSHAGLTLRYTDITLAPASKDAAGSDGRMLAPMDGKILKVLVQPGDTISKGQTLAVLEAMKMEFAISSGVDSSVTAVACQVGQQVKARQLLISLVPTAMQEGAPG